MFLWESPAPQERALSPASPWSGDSARQTKLHPLAVIHRPQCPPPRGEMAGLLWEAGLRRIPLSLTPGDKTGTIWPQVSPLPQPLVLKWGYAKAGGSRLGADLAESADAHMRPEGGRCGLPAPGEEAQICRCSGPSPVLAGVLMPSLSTGVALASSCHLISLQTRVLRLAAP